MKCQFIIPITKVFLVSIYFFQCHEKTRERRKRMLSLRESLYFEGEVERSEVNLRDILRRLNELSLDLLPSTPEQSEEEGTNQTSSTDSKRNSSNRICPIHRDSGKSSELYCNHCETVSFFFTPQIQCI